MRGTDDNSSGLFSYLSPESRVRPDHPLRKIRALTDAAFAPFEYLSAIVVQELRAGVQARAARLRLERGLLDVFERRGRVVDPSRDAWAASGDVLAEMAWREGLEVGRVSKSFGNDVLLALSCRENGLVLVTDNGRDFSRLRRYVSFEHVAPWPSAASQ